MVPNSDGGVYVIDTTDGMTAYCNTETLHYQTWCSKPAKAHEGFGPTPIPN